MVQRPQEVHKFRIFIVKILRATENNVKFCEEKNSREEANQRYDKLENQLENVEDEHPVLLVGGKGLSELLHYDKILL